MEFEGFLKAAMSGPMRKGNWSSQRKELGARASKRPSAEMQEHQKVETQLNKSEGHGMEPMRSLFRN